MGSLASIERSLMDTRESPSSILGWTPRGEGGAQNAQQCVLLETYMLALQYPVGLS